MGQQQGAVARADLQDREVQYGACSLEDLQRLAVGRGLLPELRRAGSAHRGAVVDEPTLIALLKAYDAGAQAALRGQATEGPPPGHPQPRRGCSGTAPNSPDAAVVQAILSAPGPKGVDIGGSLVKMVLALPRGEADGRSRFPEAFGATGRTRYDLEFEFELGGTARVLRFISGATAQIAGAVTSVQRQQHGGCSRSSSSAAMSCGGAEDEGTISQSPSNSRLFLPPLSVERLFTAGGGAHKFAPLFRDALQIELVPVKELSAVVDGLLFLATCGAAKAGCRQEIFTVDEDGQPSPTPWPEPLFPFLLVNIGSGVSILRVDSAEDGDYVRVGGTACGGGTFLGLARALTSAQTFEEALQLAEAGDASRCDLLVRDIYGEEGSVSLGLPGSLTAANCGRLCEGMADVDASCSEQDLARALLQMVTQQSVLLSGAFARHAGCVDRVFFAGGFVEEENHIARKAIAANFRSLGGRAYFLRHADFLGALGSLRSCLQSHACPAEQWHPCSAGPPSFSSAITASPSWSSSSCSCSSAEGL
mmetsp:Transcript_61582/g.198293  ORF Transcript_61582/g.198293 Transcript_61582/m.198293 type:complete len:535 (+) Transcript_61582:105-1709(+)